MDDASLGVRDPNLRELIHHYKPRMRPTLRRRNGEITLLIMDENGKLSCQVLCERDMNELALSVAIINQDIARERINALKLQVPREPEANASAQE